MKLLKAESMTARSRLFPAIPADQAQWFRIRDTESVQKKGSTNL